MISKEDSIIVLFGMQEQELFVGLNRERRH